MHWVVVCKCLATRSTALGGSIVYYFFTSWPRIQNVKFIPLKVWDEENVEMMFMNHEFSEFNHIELYIIFEQWQQSQIS